MNELAGLSCEQDGEILIARVTGEIDMTNARTIGAELVAGVPSEARGVVLDLSETTYLDSAGIRLVFELASRLRARWEELRLVVPEDAPVRRVLAVAEVPKVAPIHGSVADATADLRAAAQSR